MLGRATTEDAAAQNGKEQNPQPLRLRRTQNRSQQSFQPCTGLTGPKRVSGIRGQSSITDPESNDSSEDTPALNGTYGPLTGLEKVFGASLVLLTPNRVSCPARA